MERKLKLVASNTQEEIDAYNLEGEHEIPLVEYPDLKLVLGRLVTRATRWNRG